MPRTQLEATGPSSNLEFDNDLQQREQLTVRTVRTFDEVNSVCRCIKH